MQFSGKRALVTGAAGGIGRAVVAALVKQGAAVVASDRDATGLRGVSIINGDLRDGGFCDALPHEAAGLLGGLDIVINNAGVITRGKITDATDADYDLTMSVNVEAPFRICRGAIPILDKAGGGAIVNTSSCWGLRPGPDHPIYVMSKSAIAAMTQCLGRDHAHQGIRVNAVCPNEVDTPMLRSGFAARGFNPERAVRDLDASVPIGHIAQPEEIADVILFLASDAARYMCGALVEVNGGKAVQ